MLVGNVEAKQKENQITYSDQNCHDKSVIYKKVFWSTTELRGRTANINRDTNSPQYPGE